MVKNVWTKLHMTLSNGNQPDYFQWIYEYIHKSFCTHVRFFFYFLYSSSVKIRCYKKESRMVAATWHCQLQSVAPSWLDVIFLLRKNLLDNKYFFFFEPRWKHLQWDFPATLGSWTFTKFKSASLWCRRSKWTLCFGFLRLSLWNHH